MSDILIFDIAEKVKRVNHRLKNKGDVELLKLGLRAHRKIKRTTDFQKVKLIEEDFYSNIKKKLTLPLSIGIAGSGIIGINSAAPVMNSDGYGDDGDSDNAGSSGAGDFSGGSAEVSNDDSPGGMDASGDTGAGDVGGGFDGGAVNEVDSGNFDDGNNGDNSSGVENDGGTGFSSSIDSFGSEFSGTNSAAASGNDDNFSSESDNDIDGSSGSDQEIFSGEADPGSDGFSGAGTFGNISTGDNETSERSTDFTESDNITGGEMIDESYFNEGENMSNEISAQPNNSSPDATNENTEGELIDESYFNNEGVNMSSETEGQPNNFATGATNENTDGELIDGSYFNNEGVNMSSETEGQPNNFATGATNENTDGELIDGSYFNNEGVNMSSETEGQPNNLSPDGTNGNTEGELMDESYFPDQGVNMSTETEAQPNNLSPDATNENNSGELIDKSYFNDEGVNMSKEITTPSNDLLQDVTNKDAAIGTGDQLIEGAYLTGDEQNMSKEVVADQESTSSKINTDGNILNPSGEFANQDAAAANANDLKDDHMPLVETFLGMAAGVDNMDKETARNLLHELELSNRVSSGVSPEMRTDLDKRISELDKTIEAIQNTDDLEKITEEGISNANKGYVVPGAKVVSTLADKFLEIAAIYAGPVGEGINEGYGAIKDVVKIGTAVHEEKLADGGIASADLLSKAEHLKEVLPEQAEKLESMKHLSTAAKVAEVAKAIHEDKTAEAVTKGIDAAGSIAKNFVEKETAGKVGIAMSVPDAVREIVDAAKETKEISEMKEEMIQRKEAIEKQIDASVERLNKIRDNLYDLRNRYEFSNIEQTKHTIEAIKEKYPELKDEIKNDLRQDVRAKRAEWVNVVQHSGGENSQEKIESFKARKK